tara:strand:- start:1465 stop:2247 length:783 start_codon:yes stop_codon:yes gene_type:complete
MSEEAIQEAGSQEAVAAPNFLESIPEELRSEPSLRNFQDAGSLAKSYVHAQRMIGRENVTIPGKSATPDEWRQVYQKLGAPDAADAYQIEGMDDTVAGQFRQQAFDAGLSQQQATAVSDFYKGQQTSQNEAMKKAGEDAIYDSEQELRQEYGKAFEQKVQGAQNAAKQLLGGVEIFETLQLADGRMLGDHPDIIRMFSTLAGQIGEDQLIGETSEMVMTPAEASRQIADLTKTNGPYFDKRHPEHQHYVDEVYRLREYSG